MKPRIAILGIHLESNAFAPVTTDADFRASCYFEGEAMLAEAAKPAPAMPAEIPGFVEAMNATGAVGAGADPDHRDRARRRRRPAFIERTLARMRELLAAAGPLDGIYVSNHGAMVSTTDSDPDGALYALAREAAGPERPVVATVDLHANISQRMVDCADVIISYRTNPHVDRARARRARPRRCMRRLLAGERFEKTFIRMPIAAPTVTLLTARGAYADMIAEGQRHIGPDLPVVSVLGGFAFADAPEAGISILTYGSGAKPKEVALKLAEFAWAERDRFKVRLTSLDDAVARAVAAGRAGAHGCVCLADVADNPGGGGRGNTTDILERAARRTRRTRAARQFRRSRGGGALPRGRRRREASRRAQRRTRRRAREGDPGRARSARALGRRGRRAAAASTPAARRTRADRRGAHRRAHDGRVLAPHPVRRPRVLRAPRARRRHASARSR